MKWVRVTDLSDLPEGEMIGVSHEDHDIAVYRTETGEVYATDNVCTHEYALLTDGWFEGCEVECPRHAGRFDIRDGKGLCAPIEKDLRVYETRIEDGAVFVALPDIGR